jgi:hypothetical protein
MSSWTILKSDVSISSSIFLLRLHPPVTLRHNGLSRSCQPRTFASGARPCSAKSSVPPGLSTRLISFKALRGSGIVHSVHVVTTMSRQPSSNGISSPGCAKNSTGNVAALALSRAIAAVAPTGRAHTTGLRRSHKTAGSTPIRRRFPGPFHMLLARAATGIAWLPCCASRGPLTAAVSICRRRSYLRIYYADRGLSVPRCYPSLVISVADKLMPSR